MLRAPSHLALVGAFAWTAILAACGADDGAKTPGVASTQHPTEYRLPALPAPSSFAAVINHPYLPLTAGSRWVYRAKTADGLEEITVTVLPAPRVVAGVTATVVRDRVTLDGEVIELTYDWYAQDDDGNVWYLGEATRAYEPGEPPNAEGSWEAGIDNAHAGIAMPAHPEVGDRYQQELRPSVAEDRGEIVALDESGKVPWGSFAQAVRTKDTTPLEPDLVEFKYYAPGVGLVLEEEDEDRLELISYRPGS